MRGGLLRYVAGRVAVIAVAAVGLSWTVFLLVHSLPGNPLTQSERLAPERERILIHREHLDDPYPLQYLHWLQSYFAGDLSPLLLREAWITIRLGSLALGLILGLGIVSGIIAAARHETTPDHLIRAASSVAYAVPNFVWAKDCASGR